MSAFVYLTPMGYSVVSRTHWTVRSVSDGGGRGDEVDDDLVADQGPSAPVHRDLPEQPVLDFIPFAGTGWQLADGDLQSRLGREFRQLDFPGPDPRPVGTTAVRVPTEPRNRCRWSTER